MKHVSPFSHSAVIPGPQFVIPIGCDRESMSERDSSLLPDQVRHLVQNNRLAADGNPLDRVIQRSRAGARGMTRPTGINDRQECLSHHMCAGGGF